MAQREWQKANPEKVREYKRRWREKHREEIAAYKREYRDRKPEQAEADRKRSRAWHEANRDKVREYNRQPGRREDRLRRIHGITLDQFHEMWERQGGQCPICLREVPREFLNREELHAAPVKPHVDHSHAEDVIRGILCSTCNQGIGLLREDPELFRRAAVYLSGQFPTFTPQRSTGLPNADKTKCKYGHAFTEENTYVNPSDGSRSCRTCTGERGRASYLANPKPHTCPDCGVPTSKRGARCRPCAGTARWAARRA